MSTLQQVKGLRSYFSNLNSVKYLVILGTAISGLALTVNTYDAVSQINNQIIACEQMPVLQEALRTKFIVIIVLSCLAVLIGLIMAWAFRSNPRRLLVLGITTAGLFGILYALSIKFQTASDFMKCFGSLGFFIFFILLGFLVEYKGFGQSKESATEMMEMD